MDKEIEFTEVELVRGNKKVVWEWIGEGWSGDYNPEDKEDTPLLRFSCYEFVPLDQDDESPLEWLDMEDSSYCTRMPVTSPLEYLARAAAIILEAIEDESYKKELERLSWFCPEDFEPKKKKRNKSR